MVLVASSLAYFRAMSDLGSRAIVMAAFLMCHDKPQTASWLEAVVELCHQVLWMGEWTGVHPPGMDSSQCSAIGVACLLAIARSHS